MERNGILEALEELGRRAPVDTEMVIVGGAAAVLCRWLSRATADVDVLDAEPKLSRLAPAIREVAEALGLPERWRRSRSYARSFRASPTWTRLART